MTRAAVPDDLVAVVTRHGEAVAAGDQQATLADFRPDRIGQLVASAKLPVDLDRSQVLGIELEPDGLYAAFIRYTARDGAQQVLRSRWVRLDEGWRVTQVRNIPETPPVMPSAGPSESGLDSQHWEGLRAGEVRVQQCDDCSTWIWAPKPLCPACHSFRTSFRAVEPEGRLYSWTRTWQPFSPDFAGHLPFVIALVELPRAGGRRLLGVLMDSDGGPLRIGAAVRAVIEPAPQPGGWPVLRWQHVDQEAQA